MTVFVMFTKAFITIIVSYVSQKVPKQTTKIYMSTAQGQAGTLVKQPSK
jgi:hypothetical protein